MKNTTVLTPMVSLVLVSLLAGTVAGATDSTWEEVRRDRDIVVYQKQSPDYQWVSVRGKCIADAPVDVVAFFFSDVKYARTIFPHCRERRVLKTCSDGSRIEYQLFRLIPPFKDRYFVCRRREYHSAPDKILISMTDSDRGVINNRKKIRARTRNILFSLESFNQNRQTLVTAQMEINPQGHLPCWLVNIAVKLWMHDMFINLKKVIEKKCRYRGQTGFCPEPKAGNKRLNLFAKGVSP